MYILVLMNTENDSIGYDYIGPFYCSTTAHRICNKINKESNTGKIKMQFFVQLMRKPDDYLD